MSETILPILLFKFLAALFALVLSLLNSACLSASTSIFLIFSTVSFLAALFANASSSTTSPNISPICLLSSLPSFFKVFKYSLIVPNPFLNPWFNPFKIFNCTSLTNWGSWDWNKYVWFSSVVWLLVSFLNFGLLSLLSTTSSDISIDASSDCTSLGTLDIYCPPIADRAATVLFLSPKGVWFILGFSGLALGYIFLTSTPLLNTIIGVPGKEKG